jgi:hypothetical protein
MRQARGGKERCKQTSDLYLQAVPAAARCLISGPPLLDKLVREDSRVRLQPDEICRAGKKVLRSLKADEQAAQPRRSGF